MNADTVYAVKLDITQGAVSVKSLWWTESEAKDKAETLARELVARSPKRSLERDQFDTERWNVLEPDNRWPDDKPKVIASFYVMPMEVQGSAVDRLAAVTGETCGECGRPHDCMPAVCARCGVKDESRRPEPFGWFYVPAEAVGGQPTIEAPPLPDGIVLTLRRRLLVCQECWWKLRG